MSSCTFSLPHTSPAATARSAPPRDSLLQPHTPDPVWEKQTSSCGHAESTAEVRLCLCSHQQSHSPGGQDQLLTKSSTSLWNISLTPTLAEQFWLQDSRAWAGGGKPGLICSCAVCGSYGKKAEAGGPGSWAASKLFSHLQAGV